ncbi:MAG: sel1 repeat family protein [Pseudomonadota bacterium]
MRIKNLLRSAVLSAAVLILSGCVSSEEKEAMNNPQYILGQAKQAYFENNYRLVFQLLFPLAAKGNDQAQYTLGYLYHHGLGVEKNDQQAMNWIQRAAAQGNKKALEALSKQEKK